jgi:hypothetical protein
MRSSKPSNAAASLAEVNHGHTASGRDAGRGGNHSSRLMLRGEICPQEVKGVPVKRGIGSSRMDSPARSLLLLAGCIAAGLVATSVAASAARAAKVQKLVLYSVATQEGYVNNVDDRERGIRSNPFGNFKDSTSATKESGVGPFAGDEAMFTFRVFKGSDLGQKIGTATFTCLYNFNKNAFCNVSYDLSGGSLIGGGAFNFAAKRFVIAITGGTGKYRGMRGDMAAAPGAKSSQRLTFTLF